MQDVAASSDCQSGRFEVRHGCGRGEAEHNWGDAEFLSLIVSNENNAFYLERIALILTLSCFDAGFCKFRNCGGVQWWKSDNLEREKEFDW